MKVFVGSVIVVGLLLTGIWLLLSPAFSKVGETAEKLSDNLKGGEKNE